MYGKVFQQIYDSSICTNWKALVTFQQFIVMADSQGIVDITPHAIAQRTGIPEDIIRTGIEALERPDPESRSPEEEGRRIVRLQPHRSWGWRLVNYAHYRDLASREALREGNRERKREERGRSRPVTPSHDSSHLSRHPTPTPDASTERGGRSRARPAPADFTLTAERQHYAEAKGLVGVADQFERFLDHHRAKGSVFRDWDAAWRTWVRNGVDFQNKAKGPVRRVDRRAD